MCCQGCNKNQTRRNSLERPSHCSAFADSVAPSAQLLHAPYGSLGSNSYLCALKHFLCIYPRWESSQNGAGQTNAVDKMGKVQSIKHHTVWKTLSESPQTHSWPSLYLFKLRILCSVFYVYSLLPVFCLARLFQNHLRLFYMFLSWSRYYLEPAAEMTREAGAH